MEWHFRERSLSPFVSVKDKQYSTPSNLAAAEGLQTCILELIGLHYGRVTVLPEVIRGFIRSLPTNAGRVP